MAKHAIRQFDAFLTQARSRMPALFLDYDGTLAPIVNKPDQAVMCLGMRNLLQQFVKHTEVAVISGRNIHDLEKKVGITHENMSYAGTHGLQIRLKNLQSIYEEKPLILERAEIRELTKELKCRLHGEYKLNGNADGGVNIEPKETGVTVHYREADPSKIDEIISIADELLKQYALLRKQSSLMAVDIRPKVPWNKGNAVTWFMDNFRIHDPRMFPVYIGDDETDRDAFEVVRENGVGIYVGKSEESGDAEFFLRDPREVQEFLYTLLDFFFKGFQPS